MILRSYIILCFILFYISLPAQVQKIKIQKEKDSLGYHPCSFVFVADSLVSGKNLRLAMVSISGKHVGNDEMLAIRSKVVLEKNFIITEQEMQKTFADVCQGKKYKIISVVAGWLPGNTHFSIEITCGKN
jgi:hypothetical protein